VAGEVAGDVAGDVTGNMTGDMTGDMAGDMASCQTVERAKRILPRAEQSRCVPPS
jgi:hypothetical protein